MIEINYVCGFANRLFQLSIANIIAKHHKLWLQPSPIHGIPHSYHAVEGIKIKAEPKTIATLADVRNILKSETIANPLLIRGLFQQSDLYISDKNKIRDYWLKLDPAFEPDEKASGCDLVVHVRRGDYLLHNWGAPFSYYQEAIESTQFSKMAIITDDPHDPFMRRFERYKPSIVCSHYLNDFACLIKAKKIIMSPSTFSWWGAFLSNAEEIIFPIPLHGIWSPRYREDCDLALPSSLTQYRYIICREPLKLNPIERLYFERKYLGLKIKNQGFAGYLKSHISSAGKLARQYLR
ncbi:alpha-1,2-fucosyltransferase [Synechococcus sp. FGCU-3]|nr:alpha-1,2-fucosyltransferase [Synechococcus sp. FGCU3]